MTTFIALQSRCNVKFLFSSAKRLAVSITLVLLVLAFAPGVHAQGNVFLMYGDWFADNNKLTLGAEISANSQIRRGSNSRGDYRRDYIVIKDRNGTTIASRRCSVADCNQPFRLPQASRFPPLNALYNATVRWFWGDPSRYTVPRSRGEEVVLLEAVVPLKEGKVDLSPVFKKAKKGLYNLQYRSVSRGETAAGKWSEPVAYDWSPGKPASVSIPDLKPGLYELNLLEKRGEYFDRTDSEAWILVSDPVRYEKDAASFEKARALTAKWSGEVDPNDLRGFLRAHLDHLDMQKSGKQKPAQKTGKN